MAGLESSLRQARDSHTTIQGQGSELEKQLQTASLERDEARVR